MSFQLSLNTVKILSRNRGNSRTRVQKQGQTCKSKRGVDVGSYWPHVEKRINKHALSDKRRYKYSPGVLFLKPMQRDPQHHCYLLNLDDHPEHFHSQADS